MGYHRNTSHLSTCLSEYFQDQCRQQASYRPEVLPQLCLDNSGSLGSPLYASQEGGFVGVHLPLLSEELPLLGRASFTSPAEAAGPLGLPWWQLAGTEVEAFISLTPLVGRSYILSLKLGYTFESKREHS